MIWLARGPEPLVSTAEFGRGIWGKGMESKELAARGLAISDPSPPITWPQSPLPCPAVLKSRPVRCRQRIHESFSAPASRTQAGGKGGCGVKPSANFELWSVKLPFTRRHHRVESQPTNVFA